MPKTASVLSTGARSRLLPVAGLGALLSAFVLSSSPALASTSSYACTGTAQNVTVPAGALAATVNLQGAAGQGNDWGVSGGRGNSVNLNMPVIPGQTIGVSVGCQNGFGGGGQGGQSGGGSGGGASTISLDGTLVAVAAGGGGAGGQVDDNEPADAYMFGAGGQGGDAGAGGANGTAGNSNPSSYAGQGGASGDAGGLGGLGGQGLSGHGDNGGNGAHLQGGDSGAAGNGVFVASGGGGGGGYTGGGGGGGGSMWTGYSAAGGGGGGSSYVNTTAATESGAAATGTGDGSATITYTMGAVATVDSDSQDFGTVTEHQQATKTVTVTNTGAMPLNIDQATITGTDADQFWVPGPQDTCSNRTVAPDDSCTIVVVLTPTAHGALSASLQIPSDATNGTASVALSATGQTPPVPTIDTTAVDFGQVDIGQQPSQWVTITNTGEAPLQILTMWADSPFQVLYNDCGIGTASTLSSGQSCRAEVAFAATSRGLQTGDLHFWANTSTLTYAVPLSGTGMAPPAASLNTASEHFADTNTGATRDETLTLTNNGDSPLNVGPATVTGANGDFTLANDHCSNQTVNGGDACTLDVRFAPTTRGAETASLTVPSNDAGSPGTVALSGTGTKPADISASDTSLDLGTLITGQSKAKTLTLTNTADEPLTIGTLSITGADADQFSPAAGKDNCSGQTLAAGADCTVTVQFSPRHAGAFTAALSVPSDASSGTLSVSLSGTGQDPTRTPTPTPQPPVHPKAPTVTVPTLPAHGLTLQAGSPGSRASVNLQMSAPGTVTATVQQYTHGQWVTKGAQTLTASHAGPVRLTLGPGMSGQALSAGRYRLLLQASANGQTSPAVSVPLTVALPANGPHGQPRMLSVALASRTVVWRAGQTPRLWLSYVLSRAAALKVTLNARVHDTWQQVAVFTRHSEAGAVRVQLVGHWQGRLFPARKVRLQVSATAVGMPSTTQSFTVTVVHG